VPSAAKKKSPVKGMSRGRRGVFLRLPPDLYEKLRRMAAVRIASGATGGMQGTVISLIEQAKEKRP
jgi:hypothetical protein